MRRKNMSDQEPLCLTLEEAIDYVLSHPLGRRIRFSRVLNRKIVIIDEEGWTGGYEWRGSGETWPEALSESLGGRSVIARDEAAELKAAAEEALEAIKHQQRDPAYHSAFLLLQRAARRLRAALAASEGQS